MQYLRENKSTVTIYEYDYVIEVEQFATCTRRIMLWTSLTRRRCVDVLFRDFSKRSTRPSIQIILFMTDCIENNLISTQNKTTISIGSQNNFTRAKLGYESNRRKAECQLKNSLLRTPNNRAVESASRSL